MSKSISQKMTTSNLECTQERIWSARHSPITFSQVGRAWQVGVLLFWKHGWKCREPMYKPIECLKLAKRSDLSSLYEGNFNTFGNQKGDCWYFVPPYICGFQKGDLCPTSTFVLRGMSDVEIRKMLKWLRWENYFHY